MVKGSVLANFFKKGLISRQWLKVPWLWLQCCNTLSRLHALFICSFFAFCVTFFNIFWIMFCIFVHPWAIFNSFLLLSISQPKMSNVRGKGKNKMNKKWSSCESYQETLITKLGTSISCGFGPSKVKTSSFIGRHWFKILFWKCCFEMGKKNYIVMDFGYNAHI
jgi:hypothetical protein